VNTRRLPVRSYKVLANNYNLDEDEELYSVQNKKSNDTFHKESTNRSRNNG